MNDNVKINLIGAGIAVAIFGALVVWGIAHLRGGATVIAEKPGTVSPVPITASTITASDTDLTAYKFNFTKAWNINAQTIVYQGKEQYLSNVPKEIRVQALKSAISTHEEAVYLVAFLHDKFNETVGWNNLDAFETEGIGHSEGAATYHWSLVLNRIFSQPETYLQMAAAVENADAKQDFENMAALVAIAADKKNVKALVYAHRILHDMDYWVYGNPGSVKEPDKYGAAHVYKEAPVSTVEEIERFIAANM